MPSIPQALRSMADFLDGCRVSAERDRAVALEALQFLKEIQRYFAGSTPQEGPNGWWAKHIEEFLVDHAQTVAPAKPAEPVKPAEPAKPAESSVAAISGPMVMGKPSVIRPRI